jgi:caspase domain-containing protein
MPESSLATLPESALPPEAAARLAEARRQLATIGGCALLIGVETYRGLAPDRQLFAGRNDVLSYWRVCRRLGYRARHIRMLTSPALTRDEILQAEVDLALEREPHRTRSEIEVAVARRLADAPWGDMLGEATQQAIRAGVAWLAQHLVFTVKLEGDGWSFARELTGLPGLLAYSGHGAQHGGDLALCPTDVGADLSRALTFSELRALIDAGDDIRAEGTPHPADNLTVVLDCCFAAASSRRGALRVTSLTPGGTGAAAGAAIEARREIGNRVFCASARDESSAQAVLGGRWHGAFTWAFTRALEQWKSAPSGQFHKSTMSHVELLFRARMLLEALSFPQHPVLIDRIGNLPVFHHDSDAAEDTSAEPDAVRREGQIDPSTGFAAYEIADASGTLLAQVVATNVADPDPDGSGMRAGREYWKIAQSSFESSGNGTLHVKKVSGGDWGSGPSSRPPFSEREASFWCPVYKAWNGNSADHSYHKQTESTGTWGGLEIGVLLDPEAGWRGRMKFYRESAGDLLFGHLTVGGVRRLEKGDHRPTQECAIEQSDIHSHLRSGSQYTLFDTVRGLYICGEKNSYATVTLGDSTRHKLRKPGGGPIVSGDEIYIQATQSEILDHYLRPGGGRNDLYYEGGENPTSEHIWIIESPAHAQGQPIWTYDSITLKSKAQQRYMAANGAGSGDESNYLSTLPDGVTRRWEVRL